MKMMAASFSALALVALGCMGGEDPGDNDSCGPGDPATHAGISGTFSHPLSGDEVTVSWDAFTAGANNDCTPDGADVTSVTITGYQPESGFVFTLCLPRPDEIGGDPLDLAYESTDHAAPVEVIDLFAQFDDGCMLAKDPEVPPSGTVTFAGFCADGTDPAGFAIAFDATFGGVVTCPRDTVEPEAVTVTGSAVVSAL